MNNIKLLFFIKLFMIYKETFSERIKQSFSFMKNHFFTLVIPINIFYLVIYYIFNYIWMYLFALIDTKNIDSELNYQLIIYIFSIILVYLTLEIWVVIWLFRTISDLDQEKEVNVEANYKYWFSNILNLFKTYYYIFIYIYLIPSLIFILWWIYFIYMQNNNLINLKMSSTWDIISIILWWILILILFSIYITYKSNKAIFWVVSAISNNNFEKENFDNSVSLTKWNWWRIFWNFLLIWIIISILTSIINWVFQIYSLSQYDSLLTNFDLNNLNYNNLLKNLDVKRIFQQDFLQEIVWRIIYVFTTLFISIFTYFFYKRLEFEALNKDNIINNQENISQNNSL